MVQQFLQEQISMTQLTDEQRMEQVYNNYQLVDAASKLANLGLIQGDDVSDEAAIEQLEWLSSFFSNSYDCSITSLTEPMTDPELTANRDEVVASKMYGDFKAFMNAINLLVVEHRNGKVGMVRELGDDYVVLLRGQGHRVNKNAPAKERVREVTQWFIDNATVEWAATKHKFFKLGHVNNPGNP